MAHRIFIDISVLTDPNVTIPVSRDYDFGGRDTSSNLINRIRDSCAIPTILVELPVRDYESSCWFWLNWCRIKLRFDPPVNFIPLGVPKSVLIHRPGDILVDTKERHTRVWGAAGGWGILAAPNYDIPALSREIERQFYRN